MQRYRNIPDSFLHLDILPFIDEGETQDIVQFTLKYAKIWPLEIAFLADQLLIYPKARVKLPSFAASYCLFTPVSFEQSSSEQTAKFKASLFSGKQLLDLSGGLGTDDWAFSRTFEKVVSLDKDEQLNKLARLNFGKLKVSNIERLEEDAYEFVDKCVEKYDLVYLDADRRINEKRSFVLSDAEPDIIRLKERLFELSDRILIKVSPMLDIHAVIKELKDVVSIRVVSLKNEVKELLVLLQQDRPAELMVHAIDITEQGIQEFFSPYKDRQDQVPFNDQGNWFYEPGLALIKAGLVSRYLSRHHIRQLGPHSFFGVSEQPVAGFFGREFKIIHRHVFGKSYVKKYLKDAGIAKANISKRNFPMEVAAIKKQFAIQDGGDAYLFFTQNSHGEKIFFHCVKP